MTAHASRTLRIALAVASIAWLSLDAQAEVQHHGAHVHGIAHLNVALEGETLYLEFVSPAANIVGFEYAPKTPAERDIVESARSTLQNVEVVFTLPPDAGARLVEATVVSGTGHETHPHVEHSHEGADPHKSEQGHDGEVHQESEHGHDGEVHHRSEHGHHGEAHHKSEHGHDGGGPLEGSGHEHHHADDHEAVTHRDFRAVYQFRCQNPDKLTSIEVRLFELFPGIEKIEVQILTETEQTAMELTAKKPKIRL